MDTPDENTTRRMGRNMAWLAAMTLIGLLWLFFDKTLEWRENPNRAVRTVPGANAELVLKRNRSGHYVAPGTINGQPVTFMLDTGATLVSVPARLGREIGLEKGLTGQASTANGYVTVYSTKIDELGIGPFVLRQVRADLNPGMDHDDQVLLGMSVLKQLEFTQRGDTLVLRAPKSE
ncbi:MAG: TIGR02281 family clan AA aspartic protease [Azoarcus sp.]|jgi:aspartyl protease family protein|nr:TIGR02281 family clan AA aspartic protease [Azoarcus sp.]